MARYFDGEHHPQHALLPRIGFVARVSDTAVGYIAGHLTTRFDCHGELQYLFVAPEYRRSGVASGLLQQLALWFQSQGARRVCVNVEPDNLPARTFYARHGAEEFRSHWMLWSDVAEVLTPVP
jgi:GNAT superfamily N-acetyltransferase